MGQSNDQLDAIRGLTEDKFRKEVLIPLLNKMSYHKVRQERVSLLVKPLFLRIAIFGVRLFRIRYQVALGST
jgi:hypothetical protein